MLFNEPKLLKFNSGNARSGQRPGFSALQRAEIAEIFARRKRATLRRRSFSALQRAEIAEITGVEWGVCWAFPLSVLFNEPKLLKFQRRSQRRRARKRPFSALQRAEIAEISGSATEAARWLQLSVLFNEPKLLKLSRGYDLIVVDEALSVLFNEPKLLKLKSPNDAPSLSVAFQCSSTSRNC